MPVDPELVPVVALIARGTPMSEQTPTEARHAFRTLTVDLRDPATVPEVGSAATTTVPGADGPRPARVYRPVGDGPFPTVVMFHGGGFVIGDLDTHDAMARAICRDTGSVVVAVGYRLAPEHPWPAGPADAIAATRAVLADLAAYGGSEVLGVAGDSAGGNLAAIVAQQVPGIAAQLLVYPPTDLVAEYPSRSENGEGYLLDLATMGWFTRNYFPTAPDGEDPLVSPLRGVRAGLPAAVVVTAEYDPLRDEGEAYAAALEAAGVPVTLRRYDGLVHGFFDLGRWSKAAQAAIDESIGLFGDLLHSAETP